MNRNVNQLGLYACMLANKDQNTDTTNFTKIKIKTIVFIGASLFHMKKINLQWLNKIPCYLFPLILFNLFLSQSAIQQYKANSFGR